MDQTSSQTIVTSLAAKFQAVVRMVTERIRQIKEALTNWAATVTHLTETIQTLTAIQTMQNQMIMLRADNNFGEPEESYEFNYDEYAPNGFSASYPISLSDYEF